MKISNEWADTKVMPRGSWRESSPAGSGPPSAPMSVPFPSSSVSLASVFDEPAEEAVKGREFVKDLVTAGFTHRRRMLLAFLLPLAGTLVLVGVSSSARPALLGAGFGFSLACAFLVAFVSTRWRDTFASPAEVERCLGLPNLAAVPMLGRLR